MYQHNYCHWNQYQIHSVSSFDSEPWSRSGILDMRISVQYFLRCNHYRRHDHNESSWVSWMILDIKHIAQPCEGFGACIQQRTMMMKMMGPREQKGEKESMEAFLEFKNLHFTSSLPLKAAATAMLCMLYDVSWWIPFLILKFQLKFQELVIYGRKLGDIIA